MMKKILLIMMLVLIPVVFAELCTERTTVPCQASTPNISCSSNVTINYFNGSLAQTTRMENFTNGRYNYTVDVPVNNSFSLFLCSGHETSFQTIQGNSKEVTYDNVSTMLVNISSDSNDAVSVIKTNVSTDINSAVAAIKTNVSTDINSAVDAITTNTSSDINSAVSLITTNITAGINQLEIRININYAWLQTVPTRVWNETTRLLSAFGFKVGLQDDAVNSTTSKVRVGLNETITANVNATGIADDVRDALMNKTEVYRNDSDGFPTTTSINYSDGVDYFETFVYCTDNVTICNKTTVKR